MPLKIDFAVSREKRFCNRVRDPWDMRTSFLLILTRRSTQPGLHDRCDLKECDWIPPPPLKALTSLNKEVRPFSLAILAFGVCPLFLPLAITAFAGPEGLFSLAMMAFGAFQFIVPKY